MMIKCIKKFRLKIKDLIKKIALTFNWYMSNYKIK